LQVAEKVAFGKREITFWWRRGTVTSKTVWDEANTTITTNAQGYVSGSTSHTYYHEIWLKSQDGATWFFKTANFALAYDTGHVLDFLYAEDARHSYPVQVLNRTAELKLKKHLPATGLLHRHGWGTARVLLVLLIGLWLFPKTILDNAKKQTDEAQRQVFAEFRPKYEAVTERYDTELAAAGRNQILRRNAEYNRQRRETEVGEQEKIALSHFNNFSTNFKYKYLDDPQGYYGIVLGVAFLLFCHAFYRLFWPVHHREMKRKIDDLTDRWVQSGS
jgi:hypothetical protein